MLDHLTLETAILVAIFAGSAVVAFAVLYPERRTRGRGVASVRPDEPAGPVFLFDENGLIDVSLHTNTLFGTDQDDVDWKTLHDALGKAYPDLPEAPDGLRDGDRQILAARDGLVAGDVLLERIGPVTRLRLSPDSLSPAPRPGGAQSELETLRLAMDATPYPVWRLDALGRVAWNNAAYAALGRKVRGSAADLAEPLFPVGETPPQVGRRTRMSITPEGQGHKLWFDVTVTRQDGGDLYCAADINAVVDAEIAQRNFVQTLAKTFAQLSIGLAIFDRNRQLALFNPALIDLTALPADFLSARPTLFSFFDRMRDQRMMPEPKNYENWRQQMADLVAAAADGRYHETWSLPSGSVYSVSGRPHPDGAVAFLIEDITAEITLTRRFRSELEQGQAILDRLDEAIAVFSPEGVLVFSNEPFHVLWGVDPDRSFAQITILDATRTWQDRCAPTPLWGELRDFIATRENRAEWNAEVRLRSGEALFCNVHPIQNGATLVRFDPISGPPVRSRGALAESAVAAPA